MKRIARSDIRSLVEYEKIRDPFRQRIAGLEKIRRIEVGDKIVLVFEDRETWIFRIQERLRKEGTDRDDKVQHEIDSCNGRIPGENELGASLFIQIRDRERVQEELERFIGLEHDIVQLEIDSQVPVMAKFGRESREEDRIGGVFSLRFKFDADQVEAFRDFSNQSVIAVVHPNYWVKTEIPNDLRQNLLEDLAFA